MNKVMRECGNNRGCDDWGGDVKATGETSYAFAVVARGVAIRSAWHVAKVWEPCGLVLPDAIGCRGLAAAGASS